MQHSLVYMIAGVGWLCYCFYVNKTEEHDFYFFPQVEWEAGQVSTGSGNKTDRLSGEDQGKRNPGISLWTICIQYLSWLFSGPLNARDSCMWSGSEVCKPCLSVSQTLVHTRPQNEEGREVLRHLFPPLPGSLLSGKGRETAFFPLHLLPGVPWRQSNKPHVPLAESNLLPGPPPPWGWEKLQPSPACACLWVSPRVQLICCWTGSSN